MKETTLIYTAEITEVIKPSDPLKDTDPEQIAAWIESTLKVDDVHIKGNIKAFEREV